jgi:hypothetical protein
MRQPHLNPFGAALNRFLLDPVPCTELNIIMVPLALSTALLKFKMFLPILITCVVPEAEDLVLVVFLFTFDGRTAH